MQNKMIPDARKPDRPYFIRVAIRNLPTCFCKSEHGNALRNALNAAKIDYLADAIGYQNVEIRNVCHKLQI